MPDFHFYRYTKNDYLFPHLEHVFKMVYIAYLTEEYNNMPQAVILGVFTTRDEAYTTTIRSYIEDVMDLVDCDDDDPDRAIWYPCQHAPHTFHRNHCDICDNRECRCEDRWNNFKSAKPICSGSAIDKDVPCFKKTEQTICFQWTDRCSAQIGAKLACVVDAATGKFIDDEQERHGFVYKNCK